MQCLAQRKSKRNIQRKNRNRQETKNISFILSFIYLANGLTNATSKDIAWCPKHQIVKTVLSVRRHYPKRSRFTENLSIYPSSPAPNSPLQNSSNFGATASHWLLYILLFFFFLILTGWMRGALCVATHLYILYQAADESISGWEFFLLIPKSPHILYTYIWNIYDLVWFYGMSTIVGYLMPNPFYTYISNIYDWAWLDFMAYQSL